MPHTITYNPELRIVETKVQGMMTLSDLKQYFAETARLASRNKCSHILADFRNVTPKISTTEIYELPRIIVKIYGDSGVNARATRRAVVVAQCSSEYTFYETVTVNSGQNAKMFFDMEKAKEWLLGKKTADERRGGEHDQKDKPHFRRVQLSPPLSVTRWY